MLFFHINVLINDTNRQSDELKMLLATTQIEFIDKFSMKHHINTHTHISKPTHTHTSVHQQYYINIYQNANLHRPMMSSPRIQSTNNSTNPWAMRRFVPHVPVMIHFVQTKNQYLHSSHFSHILLYIELNRTYNSNHV